jgi:glycosyltransferase involved in cell wall biosynthesis
MSNNQPLVSIGLPIYNGEKFLREALDSLLSQTFENFELIISDNASTDKTEEICRKYADKDRRIRYYRNEENIGAARNFNRVFEISTGKYFKWAAHDDICAPNFIADCVEVLDREDSVVLCYTDVQLINEDGTCIDSNLGYEPLELDALDPQKRFDDVLSRAIWCFEVFGLMRADVLKKTSLIGKYFGSDKVLLAELSLLGQFRGVDQKLFFRRIHAEQATLMNVREKYTWIDPYSGKIIPFQLKALIGYLFAVEKAPLNFSEKLYCYLSVLKLVLKAEKWKKLLLPSSDNYFGFTYWKSKS